MMLFHPKTLAKITNILAGNPQAIGISGSRGSGKSTVASYISKQLIISKRIAGGNYFHIKPNEKSIIEIDRIRDLLSGIKLKGMSNYQKRIVIIEDAHSMTIESQNALLKAIEEAKNDIVYIFTFDHKSHILPTIMSRISHVQLLQPLESDIKKHFSTSFKDEEIRRAFLMSGGRVGLMDSILHKTNGELFEQISEAKSVLAQQTYDRLCAVNQMSHNSAQLIEGLLIITKTLLYSYITKQPEKTMRIITLRRELFKAQQGLHHNPNQKLLFTDLFLKM